MIPSTKNPSVYYVVEFVTRYQSFDEAKNKAPNLIAAHIKRSKELHAEGIVVMARAFLDKNDKPLSTMGILTSREAAEEYFKGDPFYQAGLITEYSIREWANMFA